LHGACAGLRAAWLPAKLRRIGAPDPPCEFRRHLCGDFGRIFAALPSTPVLRGQTGSALVGTLALTSAMSFAAVDLWYWLGGRISPIYLTDAAVQIGTIGILAWPRRSGADQD
jgi:hypothetical protein